MAGLTKEQRLARKTAQDEADKRALGETGQPAAPVATAPPAPSKRANRTVTVACKIPNGIVIQNHQLVDGFEPVFGGGNRPVKVGQPVGNPITLVGPSRSFNSDPDLKRVVGGYGLTFGVDADYFEKWMKDNAHTDMVAKGLIFSHESDARVVDQAKDMKSIQSGLEPLRPDAKKPDGTHADPRMKSIKTKGLELKKLDLSENLGA